MSEGYKVALITGANKGIGLETARQLGKMGIFVIVGARDEERGEAAAELLRSEGIEADALQLDLMDPETVADAVDFIQLEFEKLDILVNNATILTEKLGTNTALTVRDADLRKTFDTNFFATIQLTNAMLPLLAKSPAGRIVNVSSIVGSLTTQAKPGALDSKTLAYDASKSALNAYTIHLAEALKHTKIKVNSAHPGWVKTDMGTDKAPLDVVTGAKTEVMLATLGEDGPTGGFFHLGEALPW